MSVFETELVHERFTVNGHFARQRMSSFTDSPGVSLEIPNQREQTQQEDAIRGPLEFSDFRREIGVIA